MCKNVLVPNQRGDLRVARPRSPLGKIKGAERHLRHDPEFRDVPGHRSGDPSNARDADAGWSFGSSLYNREVMEVKPAMQGGGFVKRERGKLDRLQPEAEKG